MNKMPKVFKLSVYFDDFEEDFMFVSEYELSN